MIALSAITLAVCLITCLPFSRAEYDVLPEFESADEIQIQKDGNAGDGTLWNSKEVECDCTNPRYSWDNGCDAPAVSADENCKEYQREITCLATYEWDEDPPVYADCTSQGAPAEEEEPYSPPPPPPEEGEEEEDGGDGFFSAADHGKGHSNQHGNKDERGGCSQLSSAQYACSQKSQGCKTYPDTWRCDPNWYNQEYELAWNRNLDSVEYDKYGNGIDNACHCGCGAPDPDCGSPIAEYNLFCSALVPVGLGKRDLEKSDGSRYLCDNNIGACVEAPEGWTCAPYLYHQAKYGNVPAKRSTRVENADGTDWYTYGNADDANFPTCDCGCGIWDPDCDEGCAPITLCHALDSDTETDSDSDTEYICNDESGNTDDCVVPSEEGPGTDTETDTEPDTEGEEAGEEGEEPPPTPGATPPPPPPPPPGPPGQRYCARNFDDWNGGGFCKRAPFKWRNCPARYYDEVGSGNYGPNGIPDCNCGCGLDDSVTDPDCFHTSAQNTIGWNNFGLYDTTRGDCHCTKPRKHPKEFCNVRTKYVQRAPDGWSCANRDYDEAGTGNVGLNGKPDCDCNCGEVIDPDCKHESQRALGDLSKLGLFCNEDNRGESTDFSETCSEKTNKCVNVPADWAKNCPAKLYNEGELQDPNHVNCDCDCGAISDPDCDRQGDAGVGLNCGSDSAGKYCSQESGFASCKNAPQEWTCPAQYYDEVASGYHSRGKPYCDCDCGAFDPDCLKDTRVLNGFDSFGLICDSTTGLESTQTREFCSREDLRCTTAPASWFCTGAEYAESSSLTYEPKIGVTCNCGCGTYDPDCDVDGVTDLKCGAEGTRMKDALGKVFTCPKGKNAQSSCPFCTLI